MNVLVGALCLVTYGPINDPGCGSPDPSLGQGKEPGMPPVPGKVMLPSILAGRISFTARVGDGGSRRRAGPCRR
jgi:hypothetical protein